MLLRFKDIELDEPQRELRADGGVLPLQPRVFDLLVYLARHRDRVVAKEELLEALWPDVMVADGALQRAVSLLRSSLAQAGAGEVIRTFPRRGYRFCVECDEMVSEPRLLQDNTAPQDVLQQLRSMDGATLQKWAIIIQSSGRNEGVIHSLEQLFQERLTHGENCVAAWIAVLLAQIRIEWGEWNLGRGWYTRARRLLGGREQEAQRETAYLDYLGARLAMLGNDWEEMLAMGQRVHDTGVQLRDSDLEALGLLTTGEAKLLMGQVDEGLAALDETGLTVGAAGLSSWAGGLVYCGLIYTCISRADWKRATEWTNQFFRWGKDRGAASYPGLCRLHQAELKAVQGELQAAVDEIRSTIQMLARQAPWVEGEAWRSLAEVQITKGELAEARESINRAIELGWDTQFELAQLSLAEGNAAAAVNRMQRALAENAFSCRIRMGRALPFLVIAAARGGELEVARNTLRDMDRQPQAFAIPALQAWMTAARAELAAASGQTMDSINLFRTSLRLWLELGSPVAAAHIRCRIAAMLKRENDDELAEMELRAAEKTFRHCGALAAMKQCLKWA